MKILLVTLSAVIVLASFALVESVPVSSSVALSGSSAVAMAASGVTMSPAEGRQSPQRSGRTRRRVVVRRG